MREVTVVEGLKLRIVRAEDSKVIVKFHEDKMTYVAGEDIALIDVKYIDKVFPIMHFCRRIANRPIEDLYIVYSPEVESLLCMPFKILKSAISSLQENLIARITERDTHENRLIAISNLSWWQRLKFLFTGKLK